MEEAAVKRKDTIPIEAKSKKSTSTGKNISLK